MGSSPSRSSNLPKQASAIPISYVKAHWRNYEGVCTETNTLAATVRLLRAATCLTQRRVTRGRVFLIGDWRPGSRGFFAGGALNMRDGIRLKVEASRDDQSSQNNEKHNCGDDRPPIRLPGIRDGHRRTQRPVAAVPGIAHFPPSVAPLAQTKPARTSSSPQRTLSVPVTTRIAAAGPGSPFGPAGPAGPGWPAGPCGPGGPRSPAGPIGPWPPASPCGPWGPTDPGGPGGPAAPRSPTGPWGPTGPCWPCAPWGPAGPTGPAGPASPAGPGGPCGPGAGVHDASVTIAMAAGMVTNCRIATFLMRPPR
jgi:hypothetical protein